MTVIDSLKSHLDNLRTANMENVHKVVLQIVQDPEVHVFGEVLQEPAILQLKQDESFKEWIHMLEIFAYGTWRDAQDCKLWSIIGDEAKKKLQRLTIVQLACQQKQLHYSTIMETLGMDSVRELEDLIIDCIEYRLVRGKLDQKQQLFQVEWTMGRDVATTSQLDEMIDGFCRWENNAQLLLQKLNSQLSYIQQKETEFEMERSTSIKQMESVQRQVREQHSKQEQDMEMQTCNERRDKR